TSIGIDIALSYFVAVNGTGQSRPETIPVPDSPEIRPDLPAIAALQQPTESGHALRRKHSHQHNSKTVDQRPENPLLVCSECGNVIIELVVTQVPHFTQSEDAREAANRADGLAAVSSLDGICPEPLLSRCGLEPDEARKDIARNLKVLDYARLGRQRDLV